MEATFLDFTRSLVADLPALLESETGLRIIYDPNKQTAEAGEILLGLGITTDLQGEPIPQSGVVLQHKGTAWRSLSEFIQHGTEAQIADWRKRLGNPDTPANIQGRLYVEDASPDSCLGFIFFLARLFGVPETALPADWCDYATRWELGDTRTTGEPFSSWSCLHSALGHSHIALQQDESSADVEGIEAGFPACLRYTLTLLNQRVAPDQVPEILPSAEHLRARAHLRQEYQAYRHSLSSAEILQLRLPMSGTRRHLLIDAYLATEVTALGSKKVFLRADREHTWLGQGFSLMALYRPSIRGSGNDMVISVDPVTGIHLEALWRELERLEDQHWGGERPRDNPRPITSYPRGQGPNQPWWDDQGRYTLVAAPKKVGEQWGSRLTWNDVRAAIWSLYHPARPLAFIPDGQHGGRPLHACPARVTGPNDKRLVIVHWDPDNNEPLVLSPTLQRYLAACAKAAYPEGVPLDALPDERSFDLYELPGGFTIIHSAGVLLVDDWGSESLPIDDCRQEFERLAQRLDTIGRLGEETSHQVEQVRQALSAGQSLRYLAMVQRLSHSRLELRSVLFGTRPLSTDENVLGFRRLLEKRWGMEAPLENLHDTLEQLDSLVQNHVGVRTNRLISGLTIYGFPAALFTGFFGFVLEGFGKGEIWYRFNWRGLLLYLMLTSLAIGLIRLWASRLNKSAKPDREDGA
jgi:hypothetical protein